ncbi:MAG: general secretion pathway protein GspB [Gammaproteobacteria bacterium]
MSFILDALKKSENERQRQTGPALATVPTSVSSGSDKKWITLLVIVMAIVIAVLIVLLIRRDAPTQGVAVVETISRTNPDARISRPTDEPIARPVTQPTDNPTVPVVDNQSLPPATDAAKPSPASVTGEERSVRSLRDEVPQEPVSNPDTAPPRTSGQAVTPPSGTATRPITSSTAAAPESRPATDVSSMPTARDLVLQGILSGPQMHLDLLIYSDDPGRRAVFIDGQKYRQGDRIKNGPRVHEIVPQGAILDNGSQLYLLDPD